MERIDDTDVMQRASQIVMYVPAVWIIVLLALSHLYGRYGKAMSYFTSSNMILALLSNS